MTKEICHRCNKPTLEVFHYHSFSYDKPSCPCGLHRHNERTYAVYIGAYSVVFDTIEQSTRIWWVKQYPTLASITLKSLKWNIDQEYIDKIMVLQ